MQQFISLINTTRPRQWVKNIFLFAALIFDRKLFEIEYVISTIYGFILFTLISGAIYITNDLFDYENDKIHPIKRHRPIASGNLNKRSATIVSILLPLITLPCAFLLSQWFGVILLVYWIQNIFYSIKLKHVVIVDVLMISLGFVFRVAAGATLVDVEQAPIGSPWIYMCVGFGALLVVLGKRRSEIVTLNNKAGSHRTVLDNYTKPFIDLLIYSVSTCTIISYSLYTFSATYHQPRNDSMMLTIPLVVYGVFRYLYLVNVKDAGGTPEVLVFTDRPLLCSIIIWLITATILRYNYW